jgi:hypothetical protein
MIFLFAFVFFSALSFLLRFGLLRFRVIFLLFIFKLSKIENLILRALSTLLGSRIASLKFKSRQMTGALVAQVKTGDLFFFLLFFDLLNF